MICDGIREIPHDLVERVESGTGGDRELDCLLDAALDGRSISESGNMILARNSRPPHDTYILGWIDPGKTSRNFSEGPARPPVPRYTTSLDAVVSLFEQRLPGWCWQTKRGFVCEAIVWQVCRDYDDEGCPTIGAHSVSPARALLAACLRATQSQAGTLADAHSKNPPEADEATHDR